MRLLSLQTTSYRNLFAGQKIEFFDGINLLYGKNAAGKTNTLECAYIFASGRSFRTRHEAELIQKGCETARADIVLRRETRPQNENMSVIWQANNERGFTKGLLYQGYEVSKSSEFLGIFRAVLFTPDHLSLIKGSPDQRRNFMDIALSQLQPKYVHCMNDYLKTLANKNAYLKTASFSGKVDSDYMEVINTRLAKTAAVIIKQRNGFAEMVNSYAGEFYGKISAIRERLDIKYISVTKRDYNNLEYTEKKLLDIFRADINSELKQGRTIHGPHKDDLLIYISKNKNTESSGFNQIKEIEKIEKIEEIDEISQTEINSSVTSDKSTGISEFAAKTFGSQGQQRSAVLALKLAEGEIFKKITGEYPVFLLDDLLGELDSERRDFLTGLIRDKQTIITCCDREMFGNFRDVNAVCIENGKIRAINN